MHSAKLLANLLKNERAERAARDWMALNLTSNSLSPESTLPNMDFEVGGRDIDSSDILLEALRFPELEAVIRLNARPAVMIENGEIDDEELDDPWRRLFMDSKSELSGIMMSVARVDTQNIPRFEWIGTAFLIESDEFFTNRHVAKIIASGVSTQDDFIIYSDEPAAAELNFRSDNKIEHLEEKKCKIVGVSYLGDERDSDVAILKTDWVPSGLKGLRLSKREPSIGQNVCVIGHPGRPGNTDIPDAISRQFKGEFGLKRFSPGEIIETGLKNGKEFMHDCSTLGGNSGSPVVDMQTCEVIGIHYAGQEQWGNYAVSSTELVKIVRNH